MSTTIITAMVFPSIAIATVTVLATDSGMQPYDDSHQAGIIVTHSEQKSPI